MKRKRSELRDEAREALQSAVMNRLSVERKERRSLPIVDQQLAAMTDFNTLPGMQEIGLQRAFGAVIGISNPFFRLHETRAGATTIIEGQIYDNYSSYDYLGLNGHPEVQAAATAAIEQYGTSCSASRLVAGERPLHRELEAALAAHYEQEACVVFVSGHATNVSSIGALLGPKDLIVHDSLAHNSIVMGGTLSRAERRFFPHNDLDALDELLTSSRHRHERVLIAVEGLYSMDGDVPDLARLVEIKRRHAAWLMVDEAHSLGVLGGTGAGIFEHAGVDPHEVDIWMGTLSKTLSGCGGYIAGPTVLADYLKFAAGGFVFSVGMSPPLAAAAIAALDLMHREPERVARLHRNSQHFTDCARAADLDIGTSAARAVIPVVTHNSLIAIALGQKLFDRGINVQPIIPPAVPERSARLRFFLTSEHTEAQIDRTIQAIVEAREEIGDGRSLLTLAH
ncbi:MAG: 8-amino-7-oxononanoate synthase [Methylobacteriaceae bacterium]|jgi:8-amino-7-oxononanoate synthase|nr:8-amino-7-oxononanoate synthase [Methylobacteriaceae bacterium]